MDPEKEALIRTLQELQHSIEEGNKENIKNIINCFHQNLTRNEQLLLELYPSGIQCTTQTDLILTACQNKKVEILYYLLKESDILVHLTHESFDDTEVNEQRTEAIKHALTLEDFNIVEMLYDFWCGDLDWSGHNIMNVEMVGNVLQNARDACPDYDDQLQADFHCLLTFNAFQREIYTELAGVNTSDITPEEMATKLLEVLQIHDKYSHIEKIRREHTKKEQDQKIKANIDDGSSTYYKNLEYLYYEVYFRKLDFNVSLLILENLFLLRDHLMTRFNKKNNYFIANPNMLTLYKKEVITYEEIESEIYHFIFSTSEHWRLYLPEKRQVIIEEHTVTHKGIEKTIKVTIDLHKLYNGPVICLERESFKKKLENLQKILKEHVIRNDPILNNDNDKSKTVNLLNNNYLQPVSYMRDHYSLIKMVYYIEAIENTTNNNVLMFERVLHVLGEMLKSTEVTRHLSRPTQALLQTAISVMTIRHLLNIRNFLSHAREGELSARIENMENTPAQRFEDIKQELIMIKQIINSVLDIFKSILDKSLLEKGWDLLEQRIEGLPLPKETNCRADYIYDLYKIQQKELFLKSGNYYQDTWRHTGLTLQLLEEIPWIMQNKAKISTDIQLAKAGLSDKIARMLPSLTPYVRQILEIINDNIHYVEAINQYEESVPMSEYPVEKERGKIQTKLKNLITTKQSPNIVDLELLNHWEAVKGMLSFCLKECELFAPKKDNLTYTLTVTEACNILADIEAICIMHRSTLARLIGRRAVVLGFKIYRKCIVGMGFKFNQKHFVNIETLHKDQIASKKKTADPRLAREKLITCLISRLNLLKQTLLYPRIPLRQLVRRFDHDVKFRITVEMILADIANVLAECKIRLMNKTSKLLRAINLGNVLDHGNQFLEVIGDIFNPHDLATEWLDKAMMLAKDAESIEALFELFKGKMDYQTILAGDLLKMDNQQKLLYAQFKKSSKWETYALLTNEYEEEKKKK